MAEADGPRFAKFGAAALPLGDFRFPCGQQRSVRQLARSPRPATHPVRVHPDRRGAAHRHGGAAVAPAGAALQPAHVQLAALVGHQQGALAAAAGQGHHGRSALRKGHPGVQGGTAGCGQQCACGEFHLQVQIVATFFKRTIRLKPKKSR